MAITSWRGLKVLITGGQGFVGAHVVEQLVKSRGLSPGQIYAPSSGECDLRSSTACEEAMRGVDVVIHLAADTGGLAYSNANSATQYYNNSSIDLNVMEAARKAGVFKFVAVSCATAYPRDAPSPLREDALHLGRPSDSHLGHGMAKRNLVLLSELYHRQYGMDIVAVIPTNTYGPGDDSDWSTSHVVPATVWKCFNQSELHVWGDGSARRDFLYVEDTVEGILTAAERLVGFNVVNLGSGIATSIGELVEQLVRITGFSGPVTFDRSKPSGDKLRALDVHRMKESTGFEPRFSLEKGLAKTVDWFRRQSEETRVRPPLKTRR
jgi:GDP-L-fucose synthase